MITATCAVSSLPIRDGDRVKLILLSPGPCAAGFPARTRGGRGPADIWTPAIWPVNASFDGRNGWVTDVSIRAQTLYARQVTNCLGASTAAWFETFDPSHSVAELFYEGRLVHDNMGRGPLAHCLVREDVWAQFSLYAVDPTPWVDAYLDGIEQRIGECGQDLGETFKSILHRPLPEPAVAGRPELDAFEFLLIQTRLTLSSGGRSQYREAAVACAELAAVQAWLGKVRHSWHPRQRQPDGGYRLWDPYLTFHETIVALASRFKKENGQRMEGHDDDPPQG